MSPTILRLSLRIQRFAYRTNPPVTGRVRRYYRIDVLSFTRYGFRLR